VVQAWSNPTTPNLPDYCLFVQQAMGIDPLYLLSNTAPPPMPVLAASTGGILPLETVYVRTTYISANGETTASVEASVTITVPNSNVTVTSPPAATGIVGYNVYASNSAGAEHLQTNSPNAIGTNFVIGQLLGGVVPPTVNTANSPWLSWAFNRAMNLVLNVAGGTTDYVLAVYNCAGHTQLAITPDNPGYTYFETQRATLKLDAPSAGVVASASDTGTASTLAVTDAIAQLTIGDLGFFKSKWGRAYLAYAQDYGPTVWGLS
jgi:hypothetical protein